MADSSRLCGLEMGVAGTRRGRRPDARRGGNPRADGDGAARRFRAGKGLYRIDRRRFGVRAVRRQPLHVGGRGFDHRADLRWRAGGACRGGLARLRRRRRRAGARRRDLPRRRRRVPTQLHRRPAFHSGDYRLPRRHRRAHLRFPGARDRGRRSRGGFDARQTLGARARGAARQSVDPRPRPRRLRRDGTRRSVFRARAERAYCAHCCDRAHCRPWPRDAGRRDARRAAAGLARSSRFPSSPTRRSSRSRRLRRSSPSS